MTPHIQQTETAELIVASQSADFAALETAAPSITDLTIANDNQIEAGSAKAGPVFNWIRTGVHEA